MNRLGWIAYGLAVAGIFLLTGRESIEPGAYVYRELAPGMTFLGLSGWLVATLGPLALSVWLWRCARRLRPQWVFHLLFIPCATALYRAGAFLLFHAAGVPDGDSI